MKNKLHSIVEYEEYTRSYDIRYVAEIRHLKLEKFRVLKDLNKHILKSKIRAQFKVWDDQWEKQELRRVWNRNKHANSNAAAEKTAEAQQAHLDIENILLHTLSIDDTISWSSLIDNTQFNDINPKTFLEKEILKLNKPSKSQYLPYPPDVNPKDFEPKLNFFDKIIPSNRNKKSAEASASFQKAYNKWLTLCENIDAHNKRLDVDFELELKKHETKISKLHQKYNKLEEAWKKDKELFYESQAENNVKVEELKQSYMSKDEQSVLHYCEMVLNNSVFVLRTIHELFESDKADALVAVVLNGWVESVNKATGKSVNSCIVSVKADKTGFEEINLAQVDPKSCFKSLKGIGSSKLSGLVAIRPILQIDKTDKRFVDSYAVAADMEGENLAAMSWEDFEHLIRELFEKEFSMGGGEVKVTQASRDGGVDAIAFDPDPIRGGKIVIQAKRYTNTVGVSAVRDLYGTVLNEGATKGILVSTSDYGPDAYKFAQNKPITLLNGANLLHLLEKHGHKTRIDIVEAKQLQRKG